MGFVYKTESWFRAFLGADNMNNEEFTDELIIFLVLAIAFILMLIAFLMLAAFVYKLDKVRLLGEKSQNECGVNYMEYETARYKLLQEYRKKKGDKLLNATKRVMFAGLSVLVGGLFLIMLANWYKFSYFFKSIHGITIALGFLVLIFWIVLLGSSSKTIAFQYSDNEKDQKKRSKTYLALLATLAAFMLAFCIGTIMFQGAMDIQATNIYIALVLTVFIFAFMYFTEYYHYKIYFEFIRPYEVLSQNLNRPLGNLVADTTNTMPSGPYSGKYVKVWMEQLIANNIRRVHPETQSGSAELILAGKDENENRYSSMYWAYIENQQGKELYELPGTSTYVNNERNKVRLHMREMRAKNEDYMKPVVSFTRAIRLLVFVLIFLLIFMVYHEAYMKEPSIIKYVVMLVIVIMTLALLFSVVL